MNTFKLKQFLRSSDNRLSSIAGFTIVELMVASSIGLIIVGLTLGSVLANRDAYQLDLARTQLNQNLRSSLDLIGMNVREAGESLPTNFPVLTLTNGSGANPDTLTLRRNLLNEEEVARVCQTISAGSTVTNIYFAITGAATGCIYTDATQIYNKFRAKRLAADNDRLRVYIFDSANGNGEWFEYGNETDTGTQYYLRTTGHTWGHTYVYNPVIGPTAVVYVLEEWKFQLLDQATEPDILQVVENGITASPMNVVWGLQSFQARVLMEDGTVKTSFGYADRWIDIKGVEVTLTGRDTYRSVEMNNTLSATYFPRNVLSK